MRGRIVIVRLDGLLVQFQMTAGAEAIVEIVQLVVQVAVQVAVHVVEIAVQRVAQLVQAIRSGLHHVRPHARHQLGVHFADAPIVICFPVVYGGPSGRGREHFRFQALR